MVARVHNTQHSEVVSTLRMIGRPFAPLARRARRKPLRRRHDQGQPGHRPPTRWARSTRYCDHHNDYSVGLLAIAAHLSVVRGQSGVAPPVPPLASILQRPVPLRDGIGRANQRVTTSSAQAQAFYDQGLAYLHSYVWIEAARSFNEALRHDANLAMAYVGLSEALGELGLSAEARDANAHAQKLAGAVTEREWLRVALRANQLDAAAHPDDGSRHTAYKQRLDEVLTKYPGDVEFLLLVGQAQDPSTDGHGMGGGSSSLRFYERALARSPEYFAVHHYMTHACEHIK